VVREVLALDRDGVAPDTLGLRLAEAKDLLVAVQDTMVAHQVSTAVAAQIACPRCGRARRHKDQHTIVVRSLFGTLRLPSPRWWHCPCTAAPTRTGTEGRRELFFLPPYSPALNPDEWVNKNVKHDRVAKAVPLTRDELKAVAVEALEDYAKSSLKKYRPIAARNEDKKVFNGLL